MHDAFQLPIPRNPSVFEDPVWTYSLAAIGLMAFSDMGAQGKSNGA